MTVRALQALSVMTSEFLGTVTDAVIGNTYLWRKHETDVGLLL